MTRPLPVTAYAAVSYGKVDKHLVRATKMRVRKAASERFMPITAGEVVSVTIIPTEQYEAMVALCAAADAVLEETAGRKALSSGPSGMTIEAQLRASHYRISAWAVEEIREAAATIAALKEQDHG